MVVGDFIRPAGDYEIAGFIDDVNSVRQGGTIFRSPLFGR